MTTLVSFWRHHYLELQNKRVEESERLQPASSFIVAQMTSCRLSTDDDWQKNVFRCASQRATSPRKI